jgi:hypothetical protein
VFVIFMVLSGVIINHSNSLGLDRRHVSQPSLLNWYGLAEPETILSFSAGRYWLSFAGTQLFFNDKAVSTVSDGKGAVFNGELLIAAGSDEVLLLDGSGQLVERLPWKYADSAPIEAIGLLPDETVAVKSGHRIWLADRHLLGWQPAAGNRQNAKWAKAEPTPEDLRPVITKQYRGAGLSLERLLLDLHSGRIFGPVGMLVYDLLALILAFLAISGLVLWTRSRRNGNRKPNGSPPSGN